ncbi:hypothetical protein ACHAP3_011195, partial [Botrytis cinerea]
SSPAGGSGPQQSSKGTSQAQSKKSQDKTAQHKKPGQVQGTSSTTSKVSTGKKKDRPRVRSAAALQKRKLKNDAFYARKAAEAEAQRKIEEAGRHTVVHNKNPDEMDLDESNTNKNPDEMDLDQSNTNEDAGNNAQLKNKQPEIIDLVSSDDESVYIKKEHLPSSKVSASSWFEDRSASLPTPSTKSSILLPGRPTRFIPLTVISGKRTTLASSVPTNISSASALVNSRSLSSGKSKQPTVGIDQLLRDQAKQAASNISVGPMPVYRTMSAPINPLSFKAISQPTQELFNHRILADETYSWANNRFMNVPTPLEIDDSIKHAMAKKYRQSDDEFYCKASYLKQNAEMLHKVAVIFEVNSALNGESCLQTKLATRSPQHLRYEVNCKYPFLHRHSKKWDMPFHIVIYYGVQLHLNRLDINEVAWLLENLSISHLCGTEQCLVTSHLIPEMFIHNCDRKPCHEIRSTVACYHLPPCRVGQRDNNRLVQLRVPDSRPQTWFNVHTDDYYDAPDEFKDFLFPIIEDIPERWWTRATRTITQQASRPGPVVQPNSRPDRQLAVRRTRDVDSGSDSALHQPDQVYQHPNSIPGPVNQQSRTTNTELNLENVLRHTQRHVTIKCDEYERDFVMINVRGRRWANFDDFNDDTKILHPSDYLPYNCLKCKQNPWHFSRRALVAHYRSVHQFELVFPKTSTSQTSTNILPYSCQFCKNRYCDRDSLKRHILGKHFRVNREICM